MIIVEPQMFEDARHVGFERRDSVLGLRGAQHHRRARRGHAVIPFTAHMTASSILVFASDVSRPG
jgi:hypothetical protein